MESLSLDMLPERLGPIVRRLLDGGTAVEQIADDRGVMWTVTYSPIKVRRLREDVREWAASNPGEAQRAQVAQSGA